MLTPFGKEVRKLRIENSMLLRELAEGLDVTVSWLSAVETGRKNVPEHLPEKIAKYFNLPDSKKRRLIEAARQSQMTYKLRIEENSSDEKRRLALSLARRFTKLSPEEIKDIQEILNRRLA